jgi:hypothetical protein
MASTKTILASMEWVKRFIYNRNISIGDFKEPLITSVNTVFQTILGKPFHWSENRVVTGFVTTAGQQDYLLLYAWPASQVLTAGTFVIDSAGNTQKVTTPGTTNATIPSFNGTLNSTTTDNTITWTNVGKIPNASASYSYGWIENVSVQDPTSSKWIQIENKVDLALDSAQSRPQYISAEIVGTLGIVFRLMPVPDKAYVVALTLQQAPPLITSLNQTWAPLPDYLGYVYNTGLLAWAYEFADDNRSGQKKQEFVARLLGAAEGLTATEVDIFLSNFNALSLSPIERQIQMQQGNQGRSTA